MDVIMKKPIRERGMNFACVQEDGVIASEIVSLNGTVGRSIAVKNFKHLIDHFDPSSWAGNGPDILSNIVKSMCNTKNISLMNRENCQGFRVLPQKDCYEINYPSWKKFFDSGYFNEAIQLTKDSFAIHVWNYLSASTKLSTKSLNVAYIEYAKEFCPRSLKASGAWF